MKPALQITILFLALSGTAFCQKTTVWKGGTPGMKNDWYCPQNWSTLTVPDEFSDVIIPDVSASTFALPVIRSGCVEVNSLSIHPQSSLTIRSGASVIVLSPADTDIRNQIRGDGGFLLREESAGTGVSMAIKSR